MLDWESGSLEFLKMRFTTAPATVTSMTVEMSLVPQSQQAGDDDWHAAEWESGQTIPTARLKIGPAEDAALDLALGVIYILRARVTGGGEKPIVRSGLVRVV